LIQLSFFKKTFQDVLILKRFLKVGKKFFNSCSKQSLLRVLTLIELSSKLVKFSISFWVFCKKTNFILLTIVKGRVLFQRFLWCVSHTFLSFPYRTWEWEI